MSGVLIRFPGDANRISEAAENIQRRPVSRETAIVTPTVRESIGKMFLDHGYGVRHIQRVYRRNRVSERHVEDAIRSCVRERTGRAAMASRLWRDAKCA